MDSSMADPFAHILDTLTWPLMKGGCHADPKFSLTSSQNEHAHTRIQDLITFSKVRRSLVSVWPGGKAGPAQGTILWVHGQIGEGS